MGCTSPIPLRQTVLTPQSLSALPQRARLRTNPARLSGQGDQKPETASPGREANVTPSSDPASGLGEGEGGQTAVVSAPGQTASRRSHPRYVSGKISPTSSPAQLSSTRSTRAPTGRRTGSRHSPGGPSTRKVNPSSLQNHWPLRRSSILACATERVPPPPLPISPALSLTVSSKRHRQRVRVCLGTAGGYLLHCQHTSKARGETFTATWQRRVLRKRGEGISRMRPRSSFALILTLCVAASASSTYHCLPSLNTKPQGIPSRLPESQHSTYLS